MLLIIYLTLLVYVWLFTCNVYNSWIVIVFIKLKHLYLWIKIKIEFDLKFLKKNTCFMVLLLIINKGFLCTLDTHDKVVAYKLYLAQSLQTK